MVEEFARTSLSQSEVVTHFDVKKKLCGVECSVVTVMLACFTDTTSIYFAWLRLADIIIFVCIEKRKSDDYIHQMVLIRLTTNRFKSKKITICCISQYSNHNIAVTS